MFLKAREFWGYVDGSITRPAESGKAQTTWDSKDQLALSSIALGLKLSEQEHIYNCTTAKAAWDQLEEIYSGTGMHRLLSLMKRLTHSKLEKQGMKDYMREVRQTANEIAEIGHKLSNAIVITYILNGLPEKYRYLVVNLESQVESINFQDLTARLVDEEKRSEQVASELEADTLRGFDLLHTDRIMVARGNLFCNGCGKAGHTKKNVLGLQSVDIAGDRDMMRITAIASASVIGREWM
jgi:hypothetical protein